MEGWKEPDAGGHTVVQGGSDEVLTFDEVREQMLEKYGRYFLFEASEDYKGELFWALYKLNPTQRELALIAKCVYLRDRYGVHSFHPSPDRPTLRGRRRRFWKDLEWKHPVVYEVLMTLPLALSTAALLASFLR